jgi:hypothetical protein
MLFGSWSSGAQANQTNSGANLERGPEEVLWDTDMDCNGGPSQALQDMEWMKAEATHYHTNWLLPSHLTKQRYTIWEVDMFWIHNDP